MNAAAAHPGGRSMSPPPRVSTADTRPRPSAPASAAAPMPSSVHAPVVTPQL